ncbi:MAG TPA: TonB family protein [Steroidobacteraceae bacterium]|nr:TonB family protein [Steroidobacteraceae bacterium]
MNVSTKRALGVGFLWAAVTMAVSAPAPVPTAAVVSVIEGEPLLLVRGSAAYSAGTGTLLSPGDLIESKPDSLSILEFRCGATLCAVAALGSSTRAYWMDRQPGGATFGLLGGWIKVDTLTSAASASFKVLGTHLGGSSSAGTYIVHAQEEIDEVFHESGTMTLWVQKPEGSGVARNSSGSEFASRSGTAEVQLQPRPTPAFAKAMPTAFRDPLPTGISARLHGVIEPKFVRDVSYGDVSAWLAGPREWRKPFVARFRPRLKDTIFFHELDMQMSRHPEWNPILHPPPPPPPVVTAPSEAVPGVPTEIPKNRGDVAYVENAAAAHPSVSGDAGASVLARPAALDTHAGADHSPLPTGTHVPAVIPSPESQTSMNACPHPTEAQGQTGSVGLLVYISPEGSVLDASVTETSGSDALDRAAVSCVQRKAQFSPLRDGSSKGHWGHMKFVWSVGG